MDQEDEDDFQELERVNLLMDDYREDPAKCTEAASWAIQDMDSMRMVEVLALLHKLHYTDPVDLEESGVLTKLYQASVSLSDMVEEQLRYLAQEAIENE